MSLTKSQRIRIDAIMIGTKNQVPELVRGEVMMIRGMVEEVERKYSTIRGFSFDKSDRLKKMYRNKPFRKGLKLALKKLDDHKVEFGPSAFCGIRRGVHIISPSAESDYVDMF